MIKYMRSRANGVVFPWNERMAKNPNVEVISEQEAFPERFIPEAFKGIPQRVDISIPKEVVEAPPQVAPELLQEASKPFGTINSKPYKRSKSDTIAGLIGDF